MESVDSHVLQWTGVYSISPAKKSRLPNLTQLFCEGG